MISVIIPTFDEGELSSLISLIQKRAMEKDFEIIVVEGGKRQYALEGVRVFYGSKGRGKQMNLGSKQAKGSVLLFLHADTQLPFHWDFHIQQAMKKGADYGGFLKVFMPNSLFLRLTSLYNNFITSIFKRFLGDNAMFVSVDAFKNVGGYEDVPLFEDVKLSTALKRFQCAVVKEYVQTSSRRFMDNGVILTWLKMQYIRILYYLGVSPFKLYSIYARMK